jgi:hypothetical protein
MSARTTRRTCPRCGYATRSTDCCGIDLTAAGPWAMTKARIRYLRAFAHGTKGLDDDTYRLHLERAGARHTDQLTRDQYHALLRDLGRLPDVPKVKRGGRAA